MLVATIGIGSNSLRMLIADIKDAQLHRVMRDREGLRVFAALDENSNITPEMMDKACKSVNAFVQKAKGRHVEKIHLFATSAVRDAANKDEFCARLFAATGLRVEICSGDVEAMLSFLGAAGKGPSGMIDIGGGSTEIVIGEDHQVDFATSLQMGAVRLYREHPIQNAEDAQHVVKIAEEILKPCVADIGAQGKVYWVGVGGTFTTLAALAQNIPWTSKESIHGFSLTRPQVKWAMEWIAGMPMEKRMQLNGLQPQRADIVVHGMAILLSCMQALTIPRIAVSEFGNLEGYLTHLYRL